MRLGSIRVGDIVLVDAYDGVRLRYYAMVDERLPRALLVSRIAPMEGYPRRVPAARVLAHYKRMQPRVPSA